MEFKDLNIKNRYRSADTSNIGRDFIEKVLNIVFHISVQWAFSRLHR